MAADPRTSRLAHRDRTPAQRVWDRLRATDPGWDRARTAGRGVLAAVAGTALTAGLLALAGLPLAGAPMAAVVGLFGAITLPPDPGRRAHLLRVAVVAAALAVVTAAVAPWPLLGRVVLVAAIAGGAWAGRWGARGVAVGLLAFVAPFFALLLGLRPADGPGVVVACLLGAVVLTAVVEVVLPDRPAARLPRLVGSLVAATALTVDAAEALIAEGPGRRRQRRLRRRLLAVQELALLVDATVERPGALDRVARPGRVQSDVLVVEALTDHLAWAALTLPPDTRADRRAELARAMHDVRVPEDVDPREAVTPLVPRLVGGPDDRTLEVLSRLAAAIERLAHDTAPAARDPGAPTPGDVPAPATDGPATDHPAPVPVGRTVVQAAVAGVLAMALGTALSPDQWYWAVIGAYIVVTTTTTRGAGIRKATDRIIGTAIGVVVGLAVAALLADTASVALVVALALLFATFWVFQADYRLMMVLLTVDVAVLYELTGRLTVGVLGLRLAETALGATLAAAVVTLVLPTPTGRTVDGAVDRLLAATDQVLAALPDGHVDRGAVRGVDHAVADLRRTTAPLVTATPTPIGPLVRAARLLATALRVRVRALATVLATADVAGPTAEDLAALDVVRDHLARLRAHLAPGADTTEHAGIEPVPTPTSEVGRVLQAIDDRLAGYGTARGLVLRPDPGALAGGSPRWGD
jgi:hypothetical protein